MIEQHEKYANELEKALAQFSENVNKIVTEMFSFEGKKEKDWKMKCPYEYGDEVCILDSDGEIFSGYWDCRRGSFDIFNQGNIFPTGQASELEAKRRNLLTRFKAFRDECNGDWKADWNNHDSKKWVIVVNDEKEIYAMWTFGLNAFSYFGCFKNQFDAERAIELFGDEIKELFVDCEVQ